VGDVVRSNFTGNAKRTFVVVAFGLAGAASGWGAERISRNATYHPASRYLFWNLLLLLGFIVALAFCQARGWLRIEHSVWRYLVPALLAPTSGYLGLMAGLSAALGAWLPLSSLARSRILSYRMSSALCVICLIGAEIFASVGVLSLALYVLARRWRAEAWAAMMVCGSVAAAISFALGTYFVPELAGDQAAGPAPPYFIFLTQTLYAACAGYWLADNRVDPTRSE
jgi:hypothetical protein